MPLAIRETPTQTLELDFPLDCKFPVLIKFGEKRYLLVKTLTGKLMLNRCEGEKHDS